MLTVNALRAISDSTSYSRGKYYFSQGQVRNIDSAHIGKSKVRITGTVHGSIRYRASLEFDYDTDAVITHSCSCPYNWGGACKHIIALGLAYVDQTGTDIEEEPYPAVRKKSMAQNRYSLDKIRILISYIHENDLLCIQPEAIYGPHFFPLCATGVQEHGEGFVIDRDRETEYRAWNEMCPDPGIDLDEEGKFYTTGSASFYFLKYILPELEMIYEIVIDQSARHLTDIEKENVETEWQTAGSGIDFLDFKVELHCANANLTIEQLQEMMQEGNPYVRREDGSFVELGNTEEIESLFEFLETSKKSGNGKYSTKLFRVPEMLSIIQNATSSRLTAMDGYVKTFLDESQNGKPIIPVTIPARLEKILRPYQKRGVEWGMFLRKYHFGGILADDMGLGKTLQALTLISQRSHTKTTNPSIVICPKTLINTWMTEAAHYTPELKTLAIEGTTAERRLLMKKMQDVDLIVTSYPLLLRDIKEYSIRKQHFYYCILDEAQYIKNSASESAQAVKCIAAEHRLALSGTPLENGIHELWSIFDFLMPGFLHDKKTFTTRFLKPIHDHQDQAALATLQAKIKPFMLRRTKTTELKDLPAKIEQIRFCSLTPEQIVLYSQTMDAVKRDVFKVVEEKGFKRSRIEILSALMRLRQVCNHPALILKESSKDPIRSGKMPHAMEIIQEAIEGDHKVLVFSAFTSMLDIIRVELDAQGIGHVTIEGKTKNRAQQIKIFSENPNIPVFLLSLKAGGVGLTLTAADTVILFDPWWNPMAETQAMDRAHRIGQTKTVNVYKLITKDTIEERVLALQDKKKKIFDAMMGETGEALGSLTWDDIKSLFDI